MSSDELALGIFVEIVLYCDTVLNCNSWGNKIHEDFKYQNTDLLCYLDKQ